MCWFSNIWLAGLSQHDLHIHVFATFFSFSPRCKSPSLVIKVSHEWYCYCRDFQATMSLKTGKCQEPGHETWQTRWLTWLSAWEKQPVKKSVLSCSHQTHLNSLMSTWVQAGSCVRQVMWQRQIFPRDLKKTVKNLDVLTSCRAFASCK